MKRPFDFFTRQPEGTSIFHALYLFAYCNLRQPGCLGLLGFRPLALRHRLSAILPFRIQRYLLQTLTLLLVIALIRVLSRRCVLFGRSFNVTQRKNKAILIA